ncbi:hypothetical protein MA5S0422_0045 [Mycobacteroides abscessus 5S-0422]|uniref:Uncharacterized protein n=1 Tax=Mycobacteroides abscessus subsp. bolletii 1513 TaxID=1299321 RepID=X8DGM0_9MYCO|nr:hypothetical protein MA5S0421_4611 [Mycobacteroides abscessus 5S-0421]EIU19682.1 hypothetical protein MA5S0422_0045 [Mycobacteroides abscessus 5S-0422]EIU22474.1 hypothetical protein MA5S0708_4303 [Mycobacteroides abscessus 5S-0708]EIU23522.1 hypothetical protein MA5S0817_3925 [Mycobacteroides abscessus 5S-0817]EIU29088.1 hypothetical protein MA5S1212_4060 [Mycobacteroides abscessus 5S-1212]EIU42347.1 hypothetical protein MA5S1215_4329 [Mycobacteroides abscessus 5S-1215]EUA67211.1 hypothet
MDYIDCCPTTGTLIVRARPGRSQAAGPVAGHQELVSTP